MIKTKHNSNQKTTQITLTGEKIQEYIYKVLGFVPADVIRLKNDVWFSKITKEQIKSAEKELQKRNYPTTNKQQHQSIVNLLNRTKQTTTIIKTGG